jgi:hypothetical protein
MARRGDAAALAKALGKPQSFVNQYVQGRQHANLDTSVALAQQFHFSLRTLTGLDPYPEYDEETATLLKAWREASPDLRNAVWRALGLPQAPPGVMPQLPPRRAVVRVVKGRKNRSGS